MDDSIPKRLEILRLVIIFLWFFGFLEQFYDCSSPYESVDGYNKVYVTIQGDWAAREWLILLLRSLEIGCWLVFGSWKMWEIGESFLDMKTCNRVIWSSRSNKVMCYSSYESAGPYGSTVEYFAVDILPSSASKSTCKILQIPTLVASKLSLQNP